MFLPLVLIHRLRAGSDGPLDRSAGWSRTAVLVVDGALYHERGKCQWSSQKSNADPGPLSMIETELPHGSSVSEWKRGPTDTELSPPGGSGVKLASSDVVPVAGVEPARPCGHGILSPGRLPIPPHRHRCLRGRVLEDAFRNLEAKMEANPENRRFFVLENPCTTRVSGF